ncbi:MAG TPA: hypothetical protein VMP08_23895, partial [Anaerolineae bacterium]|nr:hypothetical protein [Anaerolineae bacterium]
MNKSIRYYSAWAIIFGLLFASPAWQPALQTAAYPATESTVASASASEDFQSTALPAVAMTTTLAPEATYKVYLPFIARPSDEKSWPMAGANPQRTSWTAEEVRGALRPEWYRVVDSYIPAKVQIVAANNTLFVSTANGLYALDAQTGATRWVYATD